MRVEQEPSKDDSKASREKHPARWSAFRQMSLVDDRSETARWRQVLYCLSHLHLTRNKIPGRTLNYIVHAYKRGRPG